MAYKVSPVFSATAILLVAASLTPARAASGTISLQSGQDRRTALVVEFSRLKRVPRETIIVLQGGKGLPSTRRGLGLEETAESNGSVIVYPEPRDGAWKISTTPGEGDDVVFIERLIAKLTADGTSDSRRIYLVGVGVGGLLALQLGCTQTNLFAGMAILGAALPSGQAAACKPSKPIRVLVVDGDSDAKMPIQGGRAVLPGYDGPIVSAADTLAPFAKAANCAAPSSKQPNPAAPRRATKGQELAIPMRFEGCKAPIELLTIQGSGDAIPDKRAVTERSTGPKTAPVTRAFAIQRAITAFFARRS